MKSRNVLYKYWMVDDYKYEIVIVYVTSNNNTYFFFFFIELLFEDSIYF